MKLAYLTDLLTRHQEKPFLIQLPGGDEVPRAFHITEAGHVKKKFLDCGGRLHTNEAILLQVWVGEDDHHRLHAGKLLGILRKAEQAVFPVTAGSLDVELEYEAPLLSQFPISGCELRDGAVVLQLTEKHTDCLAKDVCLTPAPGAAPCCAGGQC
jgi:Family of unknown function (DUF6428)